MAVRSAAPPCALSTVPPTSTLEWLVLSGCPYARAVVHNHVTQGPPPHTQVPDQLETSPADAAFPRPASSVLSLPHQSWVAGSLELPRCALELAPVLRGQGKTEERGSHSSMEGGRFSEQGDLHAGFPGQQEDDYL